MSKPVYWRDVLKEISPEALSSMEGYLNEFLDRGELGIPATYRELLLVATSAVAKDERSVATHMQRARDAGATEPEIQHACMLAGLTGGVPSLALGLGMLNEMEQ